jgi:hypothetical protein
MVKNRITINEKSLNKKEAEKLAIEQGKFHIEYSHFLTEVVNGKILTLSKVYELPDGTFLFIRDINGKYGGKGNLLTKNYFEKFIRSLKRTKEDFEFGRTNNISHWYFYSKNKNELVNNVNILMTEISNLLEIEDRQLDFTTQSLDLLTQRVKVFDLEFIFKTLYDHLAVYIGEVIIKNSKQANIWVLEPNFNFPVISTAIPTVFFSPVNIVWEELTQILEPNFRTGYRKELRIVGSRIKLEQTFQNLSIK